MSRKFYFIFDSLRRTPVHDHVNSTRAVAVLQPKHARAKHIRKHKT